MYLFHDVLCVCFIELSHHSTVFLQTMITDYYNIHHYKTKIKLIICIALHADKGTYFFYIPVGLYNNMGR